MATKLVNCTPHEIVFHDPLGIERVLPPSGSVARVQTTPGVLLGLEHGHGYADCIVPVHGVPVAGPVTGLPDPVPGVIYVVSAIVLREVAARRPDVVAPGTGPNDGAVRADGKIVAVTRLVRG